MVASDVVVKCETFASSWIARWCLSPALESSPNFQTFIFDLLDESSFHSWVNIETSGSTLTYAHQCKLTPDSRPVLENSSSFTPFYYNQWVDCKSLKCTLVWPFFSKTGRKWNSRLEKGTSQKSFKSSCVSSPVECKKSGERHAKGGKHFFTFHVYRRQTTASTVWSFALLFSFFFSCRQHQTSFSSLDLFWNPTRRRYINVEREKIRRVISTSRRTDRKEEEENIVCIIEHCCPRKGSSTYIDEHFN